MIDDVSPHHPMRMLRWMEMMMGLYQLAEDQFVKTADDEWLVAAAASYRAAASVMAWHDRAAAVAQYNWSA